MYAMKKPKICHEEAKNVYAMNKQKICHEEAKICNSVAHILQHIAVVAGQRLCNSSHIIRTTLPHKLWP
jgi:hypothetical protein